MTAVQPQMETKAEPLTIGLTFRERAYSVGELAVRFKDLEQLIVLLMEADRYGPGAAERPAGTISVRQIRMASPLEVWLSITLAAGSAPLLANRLIGVVRNMSRLRVHLSRDRYEAEAWAHAHKALTAAANPHAPSGRIGDAANALSQVELLAIEPTDQVEQQVVVVDEQSLPPAKDTGPLSLWLRDHLEQMRSDDET